jgi:RND family efflux transporter MFP subunit
MNLRPFLVLALMCTSLVAAAEPATIVVRSSQGGEIYAAEGVVEALRQSVISPQVAGRVVELRVKAGDRVSAGQVLARIDAQAAVQQAAASQAQVEAARAQLEVAKKEFERQQQLFRKQYISQAALEQAEAQFKATEAGVRGTLAQASAATTQTGFFTLTAPYAGLVAEVNVEQGDMAMPGKPLLTVYDPAAMRVVASLPQSRVAQLPAGAEVRIELAGQGVLAKDVSVLPAANPVSHTQQVRLGLPAGLAVVPGMFARVAFPLQGGEAARLMVPASAVLRRSELTAVYVLNAQGKALLRQVRLGRQQGSEIELLSGVSAGERVLLDPSAAARQ